jgi:pimeloyl-ACP methyl ester carboxylesterase
MSTGKSARLILALLSVAAIAVAGGTLFRRYQHDIRAARDRLATCDRQVITTAVADVEYVDRGAGEPLLVSHGIFGSCESVLLFADLFGDRRVVAPARFGYLGSRMPAGATPADQADAFVALLDAVGIGAVDVVGISAGATSVLQLAVRHPERLKHLVVLSGNLPGSRTAVVQPSWARLVNRQLPMWALKLFAPATMAFLAGVPRGLAMTSDDSHFVAEFIDSLFPVSPNVAGVAFDAFVSNVAVNSYELETIRVPTLLVHAKDDPLVSYDAAERAANRIPGAHLVSLDSGGHLMVGQADTVRSELASFFSEPIAD